MTIGLRGPTSSCCEVDCCPVTVSIPVDHPRHIISLISNLLVPNILFLARVIPLILLGLYLLLTGPPTLRPVLFFLLLHSLEPRASVRALPDPVLGEGGADSEVGGVCCGRESPPWESVLLRRPPSFF